MTLVDFLHTHDLNRSLLLGFYGGGNYGDELLMEVLAGLLQQQGRREVLIAFQHPEHYQTFHHDFGYSRVNIHDKKALLSAVLRQKRIVVGGGGLWGMDVIPNVLLMSIMLWVARWILGKKIYLLAVGYYNSTPRIGKVAAWFAGKAAHAIIARDQETYTNFRRLTKHASQDTDAAWYIDQLDLASYRADADALERALPIHGKTLFITLRRFKQNYPNPLIDVIEDCLKRNAGKPVIVALMEPRHVDPDGYKLLEQWKRAYPHIQIIDFAFNPLALFLLFRKHHNELVFIGPQFHAILSAHLTGVPYLPLAYDNKVHNLLQSIAPEAAPLPVQSLRTTDVQQFIDTAYGAPA